MNILYKTFHSIICVSNFLFNYFTIISLTTKNSLSRILILCNIKFNIIYDVVETIVLVVYKKEIIYT